MPRRPVPPDDERQGLEQLRHAVHVFNAAERRLRARYQRAGESLSLGHLRALFALMDHEATAGQLARDAELNPASVTAMVDQLEAQGLVERRRDDVDRRVCWISLTATGRSEVAAKESRWRQHLAEAFADTPDRDLETACRVLERLAAVFDLQQLELPEPA
jgi:DNA-binding MarR family transcriptional regulator